MQVKIADLGSSNTTHLESIVIDGLSMRIYQDGKPKGNATLPRLVTDCDSDVLELGQEGTATLIRQP
jgi:hypothetical protein